MQFIYIPQELFFVSCWVDFMEYFSVVSMHVDMQDIIDFNHGIYVNDEQVLRLNPSSN